jgi:Mce-associated membrane protein
VASTEPKRRTGPAHRGSVLALAGALVILAALVLGAVHFALRDSHRRHAAAVHRDVPVAQQAVLTAAKGEAVALTSISYQTADRDIDRVLSGATGALRTQFAKQKPTFPSVLAKTKSVSKGTVLSAALSSLDATKAQALVAVDATISGTDTSTSGVLKHYRMVVSLQRINGKWLSNDVAFAGQPS